MSRRTVGVVLPALVAVVVVGTGPVRVETASAAPPAHTLKVSGAGVDSYPAFDPGTERYAVTTSAATGGSVTVDATTSDPSGHVLVDGRDETGHPVTVTGLSAGDEVSVIFQDSAGTEVHSLVYLPAGFPALEAVTKQPGIAPGLVALTLTQWNQPTPNFETMVDVNGVPTYVRTSRDNALDLKLQPNGHVSVSRRTTTPGRTGSAVAELDGAFREVGRYETAGLVNTDDSDSVLLANGHRILVAQEANATTGLVDAVIQELSETGAKLFEWNSGAHGLAAETMVAAGSKDYAHIDSVAVMPDGDLLASFRHLSAVLRIARSAHDGFQAGDIVWRLGGRHSSFAFPDDPQPSGPCGQHSASVLPNGHILLFDNGSGGIDIPLCVDPANPAGPAVDRRFSRVTEYDVSQPGAAHLVWSYVPPGGRYNFFAGSAQRLANGNTLVGYATIRGAVTTEVDASGTAVWELKDASADPSQPYYSTYRAVKFPVPDAVEPVVTVTGLPDGATVAAGATVTPQVRCTDRGGSSLRSCSVTGLTGGHLATATPGTRTWSVTARDGAGNAASVTRRYTVRAAAVRVRPDAAIRLPGAAWTGNNVYGGPSRQTVRRHLARGGTVLAVVRLQNDGTAADRLRVRGAAGSRAFRVTYRAAGRDVSRTVRRGTYRTARLAPGRSVLIRVRVTATRAARAGAGRTVGVRAISVVRPSVLDVVALRVRR
jgi:Arylsulfotransferase (ASST)